LLTQEAIGRLSTIYYQNPEPKYFSGENSNGKKKSKQQKKYFTS